MIKRLDFIWRFIQTKEFILLAVILILFSQISHSIYSYYEFSNSTNIVMKFVNVLIGTMFAIGISFAILINTLQGNKKFVYVYGVIEFLINLVYYKIYLGVDEINFVIVKVLFSSIIPFAIGSYSDIIVKFNLSEKQSVKSIDDFKTEVTENLKKEFEEEKLKLQDNFKTEIKNITITCQNQKEKDLLVLQKTVSQEIDKISLMEVVGKDVLYNIKLLKENEDKLN